ncbi:MAG: hypothetical protein ACREER_09945 [Alphaproteobacteria bacterium]
MTSTKSFLASTTIWGGLVAMIAAGLGFLGYSFAEADQAQVVEWATSLAGMIGGLIAVVGRVRASKRIQ